MKRSGPPDRTRPLKRTGSPKPVSQQQRRRQTRYKADRAFVWERDGGRCRVCGSVGEQVHHRRGRGSNTNDRSLMVLVCSVCHEFIETHRAWAYEHGWLVRRNGVLHDPLSDEGHNAGGSR